MAKVDISQTILTKKLLFHHQTFTPGNYAKNSSYGSFDALVAFKAASTRFTKGSNSENTSKFFFGVLRNRGSDQGHVVFIFDQTSQAIVKAIMANIRLEDRLYTNPMKARPVAITYALSDKDINNMDDQYMSLRILQAEDWNLQYTDFRTNKLQTRNLTTFPSAYVATHANDEIKPRIEVI